MGKELFFFTTKEDLLNIAINVEQSMQLQYVYAKAYDSDQPEVYHSLVDYGQLGINKSGNHQSESFLILDRKENLILRKVHQLEGGNKFFVDQMANQNSILLCPGGIYEKNYLICGHIGTTHASSKSKSIYNCFQKFIKQQCKAKIGRYYISDNANTLSDKLRFITININQSPKYDLKF